MDVEKTYCNWIKNIKSGCDPESHELLSELEKIKSNTEEKAERFGKSVEFGTAGLRGIMGAGTNRMNVYTVRWASQGLANYLIKKHHFVSVVISFDSRKNSKKFAYEAARVMAANNIKVYITQELQPTPFLSFAVRNLKANAGVMITASHNTASYNGYKCYGDDGAQMGENAACEVYEQMKSIDIFSGVKATSFACAQNSGLILPIKAEVYDEYFSQVMSMRMNKFDMSGLRVVYTPLNGCGSKPVQKVLRNAGIKDLFVVPTQENPDEKFTTCPYPNPEMISAFKEAIKLAKKKDSDIIIATDPDADRLGACVKESGKYRILSGNEIGIILLSYIIDQKIKKNSLPKNAVVIKTIVSSPMINEMCEKNGCVVKEVLTGFKNIASEISSLEREGEKSRYLFGFEESNGYLVGTYARDKDAVSAALILCEAAVYYKQKGMNLGAVIYDLKNKYGFFGEKTFSFEFGDYGGKQKTDDLMKNLRNAPEKFFGDLEIVQMWDYLNSTRIVYPQKINSKKALPVSNILKFCFGVNESVIVRPSGTEPKIKFYVMVKKSSAQGLKESLEAWEKLINFKMRDPTEF